MHGNAYGTVFYDRAQRRKFYVRSVVLIVGSIIAFTLFHVFTVLTTPATLSYPASLPTALTATTSIPEKTIALTFDDGPNERTTVRIMDILERYHVPATFFFTGENMIEHPEIVRDVYARGFEIGNHSYTHDEEIHLSQERTVWELNATNKVLEQIIGHHTVLFRPPYLADIEDEEREILPPGTPGVPNSVAWAESLGYIVVNSRVDSNDWGTDSARQILWDVFGSLNDGHIVLMHDGGGHDHEYAIEALPVLIDTLQKDGYTFVTAGELAHLSRTETMPEMTAAARVEALQFATLGYVIASLGTFVPTVLLLTLIIGMGKLVVMLMLSYGVRPRDDLRAWHGGVSVLIPAYNEAANIRATIESVLQSSHPTIEIVVVNDGSHDDTSFIVEQIATTSKRRIRLIETENFGKAVALNTALSCALYDVVVAIDGDTVVDDHAISWLAAHFNDERVGAVAGKICAIRTNSFVGVFQDIEYVLSQNIEKSAFGRVNAVGVIPGALGAWRKDDLIRAGGFSGDTFVEDQDMTLALHALGQEVRFEPRSLAFTEVPATVSGFMRQRTRWIFGSIQCLWKYRFGFFMFERAPLSFIILPHNLVFTVLLPLLWPIVDATALYLLVSHSWALLFGSYVAYLLFDLIYAVVGLIRERGKWGLVFLVPFQRLFYRFTLSLIIFYCFVKVLEGTRAFWHKLDRVGAATELYTHTSQVFREQRATTLQVRS